MKVIVTGATGFLGRKVMEGLQRQNYQPIGLGRNVTIGQQLIKEGLPFIEADLRDLHQILRIFSNTKDIKYVVHCAALSSPWGKYADFFDSNVKATQNILTACSEFGIQRMVHISTPSIYFNYESRILVKENDVLPEKMVNHYATTKKMAEDLVSKSKVNFVILRPRGIFGPGDTTLFPRVLRSLKPLPLIDGGNALIDITYVDNVVDAILLSLQNPSVCGNCYNITNGTPTRFIDLVSLLCKKLNLNYTAINVSFQTVYTAAKLLEYLYYFIPNREPPLTTYSVGLLAKSMSLDITKARSDLGYEPKVSIEEGLDLFARWWRKQ